MIEISRIRTDGGTQSRVQLNDDVVAEYADAYRAGTDMPAVVLFYDKTDFWLADGFHRLEGAKVAGLTKILERVEPGTKRDAVLYSLGANKAHGLQRSNADKRKAVETMLRDEEWVTWSDNKIAAVCGVDHKTVAAHRAAILGNSQDRQTRTVERNGTTYQQDTSRIGKGGAQPPQVPASAGRPRAEAAPAARNPAPAPQVAAGARGSTPPSPAPRPDAKAEAVIDLTEQVVELQQQLEAANEQIAQLEAVVSADDQVTAALAEAKKWREMVPRLQARIHSMTDEIAGYKRQIAAMRKAEAAA